MKGSGSGTGICGEDGDAVSGQRWGVCQWTCGVFAGGDWGGGVEVKEITVKLAGAAVNVMP